MIANNTSKLVFTVVALICAMNAQNANAGANANLIFRNPNAGANANVISDISNMITPEGINAIRAAVIGTIQDKANSVLAMAQQAANGAVDTVQSTANGAIGTAQNAAGTAIGTAVGATAPVFDIAAPVIGTAVGAAAPVLGLAGTAFDLVNSVNPNADANVAGNVRARRLQAGLGGLGGLLSLPLSLLNLPLGLVSGLLGSQ